VFCLSPNGLLGGGELLWMSLNVILCWWYFKGLPTFCPWQVFH